MEKEPIIRLRIEFAREKDKVATDNIPEYADWLEQKIVKLFAIPVVSYCGCSWENRDISKTSHLVCNECEQPL